MRSVEVERYGGPDELRIVESSVPQPGRGEVLVQLALAGVNFIDIYMRDGSYARSHTYQTPLPLRLGMEGAGTIAALGADVSDFSLGQRVAYCLSRGAYADYAVVPAWKLVPVPEGIPLPIATALMLQGSTAHYLTHSAFPLQPGQTCLIHAGAGGVGQLLVQLAKRRGVRVIATVGSPEKAELARQRGADECILYRDVDFREEVLRMTGGVGVDVVYDSVGRETIPRSLRSLRRRGFCVSFGASSGQPEPIALLDLAEAGSVFVTRPHLADYMATPEEIRARAADLFDAYRQKALHVAIDSELALADVAAAHRKMEGRGTRGKLLLKVT